MFATFVRIVITSLIASTAAIAASAAPATDGQRLATIAARYFEDRLNLNPLEASAITGEARFEGRLTITIAPQHLKQEQALFARVMKELQAVNQQKLSPADQMTYSVLQRELDNEIEGAKYPGELLPIDQYGGLPVELAQMGSGQNIQPLKTAKNFDDYLRRLKKLPAWGDQAIANMREGIRRGVVQPKALILSGFPAIKALTDTDLDKSTFTLATRNFPATMSAKDRARITRAYREAARQNCSSF
jgi:uncharacterized protein (DUF885 family)